MAPTPKKKASMSKPSLIVEQGKGKAADAPTKKKSVPLAEPKGTLIASLAVIVASPPEPK